MLNKVMLIGRLGADPETRYMTNGDAVTNIRLATSLRWKDKQTGERKEETEWHRVVFFRGLAKVAGEYLKKGSQVYVEGRIRTNKWQKDGVDQYSTEIIADEMHMLDSKSGGTANYSDNAPPVSSYDKQPSAPSGGSSGSSAPGPASYDDFDDDIPF
jgi:single-strand DNA-binding protein